MTLARHSDPRLTTSRYARTRLGDLGSVVNKLPTPVVRLLDGSTTGGPGLNFVEPPQEQQKAVTGEKI
ncbi:hypothetical protein [Gemmata sp. SH-PL17]|uniref:hypothetical protein n=1 Tax=Gemmata sp. SH-PL17 TaxID=1630693 RepID=UPI0012FAFA06|nr:hypothetical protein [Gemmata sp. SH-PL17]